MFETEGKIRDWTSRINTMEGEQKTSANKQTDGKEARKLKCSMDKTQKASKLMLLNENLEENCNQVTEKFNTDLSLKLYNDRKRSH